MIIVMIIVMLANILHKFFEQPEKESTIFLIRCFGDNLIENVDPSTTHQHGEGNTLHGNLEPRVFRLESLTLDTQEKISNVGKENALLSSQLDIFEVRFTGKLDTWAVSINAELEKKFSPLQMQIAAMEVQTRTTHWVIIFGGFSLLFWLLKEFMKNVREHNNDHTR